MNRNRPPNQPIAQQDLPDRNALDAQPFNRMQRALFWLAGATAEDAAALSARTRTKIAALGLAFAIGLVVLLGAWLHVGVTYFGGFGVLVPGLAVPMAMVLGLDRLIAMQTRTLVSELAPYNLPAPPEELASRRNQRRARVMMALVFSAVTTFTLLLSLSQDGIRQAQRDMANRANAPLRQAREEQLRQNHAQDLRARQERVAQMQRDRLQTFNDLQIAAQAARNADAAALLARNEAAREAGGLEGRIIGTGPRYDAQRALEAQQATAAAQQQANALRLQQRLDQLDQAITEAQRDVHADNLALATALQSVPAAIQSDPKYVPVKTGLFADSAAFVRLYADPDQGLGHWVLTLIGAPFLFCLEMLPLLALALYGSSPLDVHRVAHNRAEAAAAVAEAEVLIARRRAAMPPVGIRYPHEPHRNPAPAAQDPNEVPQREGEASAQVDLASPQAGNAAVNVETGQAKA